MTEIEKKCAYNRLWYIKNKNRLLLKAKKWAKDNPAKRKSIRDKWRNSNLEKAREIERISHNKNKENKANYQRQHRKDNPGLSAAYCAKRRAILLQRTPGWLTLDHYKEIEQFYIEAKELQWLSKDLLHVDHIIPLQGKYVSGLHVPWNLQILSREDNCKKSNK